MLCFVLALVAILELSVIAITYARLYVTTVNLTILIIHIYICFFFMPAMCHGTSISQHTSAA